MDYRDVFVLLDHQQAENPKFQSICRSPPMQTQMNAIGVISPACNCVFKKKSPKFRLKNSVPGVNNNLKNEI